jgi:hypothetical protein
MKREEPSAKPEAEPLLVAVVEPEYFVCATPALTLPDNVTVDCAKEAVAANVARAIRVFFIANFSKV